jgi:hypothetical protein
MKISFPASAWLRLYSTPITPTNDSGETILGEKEEEREKRKGCTPLGSGYPPSLSLSLLGSSKIPLNPLRVKRSGPRNDSY